MPVTQIHENMRRCLLSDEGVVTGYLDGYNIGHPTITGSAAPGTEGLRLMGDFSGAKEGQYVRNVDLDHYFMIAEKVSDSEVRLAPALESAHTNWGQATTTESNKLIDGGADFSSIPPGMIASLRDLSDYAVITSVDSDTTLSIDGPQFPAGTDYTLMAGFRPGDLYVVQTAVLNGDEGQVMVEIPMFYYRYEWNGGKPRWFISVDPRAGFAPHPAFVRPDGSVRDNIYIGAFQGAIAGSSIQQGTNNLTSYNLSTARLVSAAGLHPVSSGQRSEFRQVAENNGPGWQIIDWQSNWAWQLLMMIEMEDLNSQSVIGPGRTTWAGSDITDDYNGNYGGGHYAAMLNGFSLREGNGVADVDTGARNVGGYLTYRGIENPWGNLWMWLDGVNYNDGRVYLNNDAATYQDDIGGAPYRDTGFTQPDGNGYISKIHNSPDGLIVAESSGSASTYLADYYWYATGWRVARAGGHVNHGDRAGFATLAANYSSSTRDTDTGSRVCFRS